jgi:glutamine synthetase
MARRTSSTIPRAGTDERAFESYIAGQVSDWMELAPMYWPTINSNKRLVDGFWAPSPTPGRRQPHGELRSPGRQGNSSRNALPSADMNLYLAAAAVIAAASTGSSAR